MIAEMENVRAGQIVLKSALTDFRVATAAAKKPMSASRLADARYVIAFETQSDSRAESQAAIEAARKASAAKRDIDAARDAIKSADHALRDAEAAERAAWDV